MNIKENTKLQRGISIVWRERDKTTNILIIEVQTESGGWTDFRINLNDFDSNGHIRIENGNHVDENGKPVETKQERKERKGRIDSLYYAK